MVGNPPWVRAEDLPPAQRGSLAGRYRWWRSGGSGFAHQPDLAIAFLERGLELLGDGGVLGFLLPAKLATAAYGVAARRGLAAHTTIHRLTDLTTPEQNGFDATVYPLALVASKTTAPRDHLIHTTLGSGGSYQVSQCRLLGGVPWILLPSAAHDALDLIRSNHPALGERFVLQLGAKTGANQIFLDPPEFIEGCLIRWGIRGRDVRAFGTTDRIRLLWPHDERGRVYRKLPRRALEYFNCHEGVLRARADYVGGPSSDIIPHPRRIGTVSSDLVRHTPSAHGGSAYRPGGSGSGSASTPVTSSPPNRPIRRVPWQHGSTRPGCARLHVP